MLHPLERVQPSIQNLQKNLRRYALHIAISMCSPPIITTCFPSLFHCTNLANAKSGASKSSHWNLTRIKELNCFLLYCHTMFHHGCRSCFFIKERHELSECCARRSTINITARSMIGCPGYTISLLHFSVKSSQSHVQANYSQLILPLLNAPFAASLVAKTSGT